MKKPNLLRRGRGRRTSQPPTEIVTFEQMFQSFSDARRRIAKGEHQRFVFDTSDDLEDFPDEEQSSSDTMSVLTHSTMATMDNNIGTGRTVDNFFYQPAGRSIEQFIAFIAFLIKYKRGTGVHPPIRTTTIDSSDDNCSMLTTSTATTTDLPGPGRIFDKYVYQVTGRLLEQCAGRIAMRTFLSADAISNKIIELWQMYHTEGQCSDCVSGAREMSDVDKVQHAIGHIEKVPPGSFILAALKELLNRTRSGPVVRRYGAKAALTIVLQRFKAIQLLVYVEQFQIGQIEASEVTKAHSKVFGGLHNKSHLRKQEHSTYEILGAAYEVMRSRIVDASGKRTHDWLGSIVRESIDDLQMVSDSPKVFEKSLMQLSLRIKSAIAWSLEQLLALLDSKEEIDCDQLVGALEGVCAAMILGFILKGDHYAKPIWNDKYDVTDKNSLLKIMKIVGGLQDDYLKGKRRRCLCLRKYLVLQRMNYLILLKGRYSGCNLITTWATLLQLKFISTGMAMLTKAMSSVDRLSGNLILQGRMLFLLFYLYGDGALRVERHLHSVLSLRKHMETDPFGSEYAPDASGHMDLASYWSLLQEGSYRSSIFEGLSDDHLRPFSDMASRVHNDGSTEEIKDHLAEVTNRIQEKVLKVQRSMVIYPDVWNSEHPT